MKRVCAVRSCRHSMWALMLPKALRLSPAVSKLVRRSDQTRWRCLGPFYFRPQVNRVDRPRRPQQEEALCKEETTKDIHLLAKYSYKPLHTARQSLCFFFWVFLRWWNKKTRANLQGANVPDRECRGGLSDGNKYNTALFLCLWCQMR